MALDMDSTCDPVSWLSATAKTMAIGLVSITIRSRGNLTARYHYTVAGQQPEDGLRHAPPPRRRTAGAGLAGRMRRTPARPAGDLTQPTRVTTGQCYPVLPCCRFARTGQVHPAAADGPIRPGLLAPAPIGGYARARR